MLRQAMQLSPLSLTTPAVATLALSLTLGVDAVTWDNSTGSGQWSAAANWDGDVEPDAAAAVIFPANLAGNVTLAPGEQARSLQFNGSYTLQGGDLSMPTAAAINTPTGTTVNLATAMYFGGTATKSGRGTLRLSGMGNTAGNSFNTSQGTLELASPTGNAIAGNLSIDSQIAEPLVTIRLLDSEQIADSASVLLGYHNDSLLDLNNFTETLGYLEMSQQDPGTATILRTGANGKLVLGGANGLRMRCPTLQGLFNPRSNLITGTGTKSVPAYDGILDLGGAVRPITVDGSTSPGAFAQATIETQIVNGGITKLGTNTLHLTHPQNSFAGGLTISQGLVRPREPGSLGTGPIALATMSSPPSNTVGIDFQDLVGKAIPNNISFEASSQGMYLNMPSPGTVTLSGAVTMKVSTGITVANGSTAANRSATAIFSGTVTDGASAFTLFKYGDGVLRLSPGNTFTGLSIQRGTLQVSDATCFGDSNLAAIVNGGCLHGTQYFFMNRGISFGSSGGSLRSDAPNGMHFIGTHTWGNGTMAVFGSGTTILDGTSNSNSTGNLLLGTPTAFASTTGVLPEDYGTGAVLALRSAVVLPGGNLSFDRGAVLEISWTDFIRPLGTGPGQFQMPTAIGGGWAAWGGDKAVNIGGSGQTLVWGQASPAFLNKDGAVGALCFGSPTGTHTIEFMNPLELDNGSAEAPERRIFTFNGPAPFDARIKGKLTMSDASRAATLRLSGTGTLQIQGNINGRVAVIQDEGGATQFGGANTSTEGMTLARGSWTFLNTATLSALPSFTVGAEGFVTATALPQAQPLAAANVRVDGYIAGRVKATSFITGHGNIFGDLITGTQAVIAPLPGEPLKIDGHLLPGAGTNYRVDFAGDTPANGKAGQMLVTGTLNLTGCSLSAPVAAAWLLLGQRFHLILNSGSDPVVGTFDGLPEGALLPISGGKALKITYLANGDNGLGGNDVAVDVVADPLAADRTLSVAGPALVACGDEIALTYTLGNAGPAAVTGARFEGIVPAGSVFLGSTPEGTLEQQTLTVPLADMPAGGNATVTMRFQAGAQAGTLATGGSFKASSNDPDGSDPLENRVVAWLPGGKLELGAITPAVNGAGFGFSLPTLAGVKYRVTGSVDLAAWQLVEEFIGSGEVMERPMPVDAAQKFFRVDVVW